MTDDEYLLRKALAEQGLPPTVVAMYGAAIKRVVDAAVGAEREGMKREGWRQCAVGQRTTQFCAPLQQAVQAEREAIADIIGDHENIYGVCSVDDVLKAICARWEEQE